MHLRLVLLALLLLAAPIPARAAVHAGGLDYANPALWVCRPGADAACTTGLATRVVTQSGAATTRVFAPSRNPPIDCFYLYPTVSPDRSTYSSLSLSPEIAAVTRDQAGRLASVCRLYAPLYRQLTESGLSKLLSRHAVPDWSAPYADILAAWRWYLAHRNHGRGVVLIGHSQGSILLHRLLSQQIDPNPDRGRLVAAFLAGDLSYAVAEHSDRGGTLAHSPLCTSNAQIGCVYVWNSYRADDQSRHRVFGHAPEAPLAAGCASPAGPAGVLEPIFDRAPADPPSVTLVGALSARCVSDRQGAVLRVTILPGPLAPRAAAALRDAAQRSLPGWGLHGIDIDLVAGNILDRISQETATWLRAVKFPARGETGRSAAPPAPPAHW